MRDPTCPGPRISGSSQKYIWGFACISMDSFSSRLSQAHLSGKEIHFLKNRFQEDRPAPNGQEFPCAFLSNVWKSRRQQGRRPCALFCVCVCVAGRRWEGESDCSKSRAQFKRGIGVCWGVLCGANRSKSRSGAAQLALGAVAVPSPGPAWACRRAVLPAPRIADWAWGGSEGCSLTEKVLGRGGYFFLPPVRGKGVWFGFVLFAPLRSSPARFLRLAEGSGDFLIFGAIFFSFIFRHFLVVGSPSLPLREVLHQPPLSPPSLPMRPGPQEAPRRAPGS